MSQVLHRYQNHKTVYTADDIPALVANLGSPNGMIRENAREALVVLGKSAVEPLVKALGDEDRWVRWEAAKALSSIIDPSAATALTKALGDERPGVRWLAAEALIALGSDAQEPVLRGLLNPANVFWSSEGAHHVLHELAKRHRSPSLDRVVAALEGPEPTMSVPSAALAALRAIPPANVA
jgi:HEAT repeat protein